MMMLLMSFLIGMATYRLWRVAAIDAIFEPLRQKIPHNRPVLRWLLDMLFCVWCLGWWIAGAATFLWYGWSKELILVWPAASLVAGLMEQLDPIDD